MSSSSDASETSPSASLFPDGGLPIGDVNSPTIPHPSAGSPPTEDPDPQVVLQIGDQKFYTRRSTLTDGSTYFKSLFSGKFADPRSDDGSYFVDADPEIFNTVLMYLRRGVLPTFFDKNQRFDHDFCRAVTAEADFFGIEGILKWIREKKYLKTFTAEYSVEERMEMVPAVPGSDPITIMQDTGEANTERTFHPSRGTVKVYTCPRNIIAHEGNPDRCGRQCNNAKRELEAAGG